MSPSVAADIVALFGRAVAYEWSGPGDEAAILGGEAAIVADAVDRRRRQFAAGRACARAALAALGETPGPILRDESRAPVWPTGITGSISHTDGYAVAVAGPTRGEVAVGVDVERIGRVGEDLYRRLFTPAERNRLAALDDERRTFEATALFSAKEAFYKAQFVLTGSWVGFQDVEITPHQDRHVLRPATGLEAIADLAWPLEARHVARGELLVVGVEAHR